MRELREIEAEIGRQRGDHEKSSLSYIASVLRAAGTAVDYQDRFLAPEMEEPYASRLRGLLEFRNLGSAMASLIKLDSVYREYREASDRLGTSLVRELVLKGRERAESLAANRRVSPEKRREKQEIAGWFRVWLEVPDLFFDWIEMRMQSAEYQHFFPERNGHAEGNPNGAA